MPNQNHSDESEMGFSLFELLLVITIVGLILSFSVSAWLSMKSSQRVSATATRIQTATNCLENYVIHSGTIPPRSYFAAHCAGTDSWGSQLVYENNGDDIAIAGVTSKTFRDEFGDHPDAAWLVASFGPDKTRDYSSTAVLWDCSLGDDLCRVTTKNALYYEINQ